MDTIDGHVEEQAASIVVSILISSGEYSTGKRE